MCDFKQPCRYIYYRKFRSEINLAGNGCTVKTYQHFILNEFVVHIDILNFKLEIIFTLSNTTVYFSKYILLLSD